MELEFDPEDILKRALAKGGEFADIYLEATSSCAIVMEDNRLEKVVTGTDSGVGVRLIYGGHSAYGHTNDLSKASLIALAETVRGAVPGERATPVIDLTRREPKVRFQIKRHPDLTPLEEKVALVKRGNEAARFPPGGRDKIQQVTVTYRDTIQRVIMFNSEGGIVEDERVHTVFLVQVVARDGELIQTGYEPVGGVLGLELFEENPPEKVARIAAERALLMLRARPAPAGKMTVVLSSEAGGTMIHEAVGHGLEADLVQQGLSVYSGKLGEKIASELITVVDDANLPNKRGSFAFDDEGTPSQRKVLIDRGVLKGFMYDRLTALKDGVASTGNGRRESYRHRPIPRMTNTLILPGPSSPEEIIRATERGLLVKKMGGGQVNTVTGDFVFEVTEGYLIEKGKMGEAVRGATLTGNGPQVLKDIDMVGSDLGFGIGTCGKDGQGVPVSDAIPTLRIPEIVVGGLL